MSDWPTRNLGDLIELHDSRRRPLSGIERGTRSGAFPYFGASGVIDHIDDYLLDGRFLLVAEDGENLNSRKLPIAFIADGRFWVNNHAHIIQCNEHALDLGFLKHWFANADIGAYVTGAAQPKLTQANLMRIEVATPPVVTQRKIAAILSAYDDLIENNNRRIKILEEMAQRIYREWFVDFRYPGHEGAPLVDSELGVLPGGWRVEPMAGIAEVVDCLHSKKPKAVQGGAGLLLQLANIADGGRIDLNARYMITESDYEAWTSRIELRAGDCVVTNVGRVGSVAQIPSGLRAAPGRNMTAVRPVSVPPNFLLQYFLSSHFQRELATKTDAGAIMDSLNVKGIVRLAVPIPPDDLMSAFEDTCGPMRSAIHAIADSTERLRESRDLLLPRLVSGEIDVTDLDIAMPEAV